MYFHRESNPCFVVTMSVSWSVHYNPGEKDRAISWSEW